MAASALCALASPALAHAMLERATPRVGSVIGSAPTEIELQFSEGVEPALSKVTLRNVRGGAISLGAAATAPSDQRILRAPVRGHLDAGIYRVDWRAVSVDSHVTQGDFEFTIKP
jgi:methionine-rich copper-binding protein CopC